MIIINYFHYCQDKLAKKEDKKKVEHQTYFSCLNYLISSKEKQKTSYNSSY